MKRGYLDITPQVVDHMGQLRELETVRYILEFGEDIGNSWEVYPGTVYLAPVNVDSRGNLRAGFRVDIKDATLPKPQRIPVQYGDVTEMDAVSAYPSAFTGEQPSEPIAEKIRRNSEYGRVADRLVSVTLFKRSGKYYTEEAWHIPPDAIGPSDMRRSQDFRQIDGGPVLVHSQEPWGFPHLIYSRHHASELCVCPKPAGLEDKPYHCAAYNG